MQNQPAVRDCEQQVCCDVGFRPERRVVQAGKQAYHHSSAPGGLASPPPSQRHLIRPGNFLARVSIGCATTRYGAAALAVPDRGAEARAVAGPAVWQACAWLKFSALARHVL